MPGSKNGLNLKDGLEYCSPNFKSSLQKSSSLNSSTQDIIKLENDGCDDHPGLDLQVVHNPKDSDQGNLSWMPSIVIKSSNGTQNLENGNDSNLDSITNHQNHMDQNQENKICQTKSMSKPNRNFVKRLSRTIQNHVGLAKKFRSNSTIPIQSEFVSYEDNKSNQIPIVDEVNQIESKESNLSKFCLFLKNFILTIFYIYYNKLVLF